MLLGRDRERREIEAALDRARRGESAVLALVGEPGIGKSALLAHAAERAGGLRRLRARGVSPRRRSRSGAARAAAPGARPPRRGIPEPQARALAAALALRPGPAQERFAVGAATLSLLAECGPLAVLVDDAQWLDDASAQALRFAFRRLMADPIAVFVAVREGEPSLLDGAGLPMLPLAGLGLQDAAALLEGTPPELAARLHRATAGNPLALLELAGDPEDLALAPEDAPVLVSVRVARAFADRLHGLGDAARWALVLAAASGSGDAAVLARAGGGPDGAGGGGGRRARRHSAPAASSSATRSPAPASTPTRRRPSAGPRTARSPPCCRTATSTAAPGTWRRPPRGRTTPPRPRSRRPARAAASAAPTGPPPRRSSARAARHGRAGRPAAPGGRGGVAGGPGRAGARAA